MLYVAIVLGLTLVGLDFIPVKFAVLNKNVVLDNNIYICRTEPKLIPPDIRWTAKKEDNPHLERQLFLKLSGENPHNVLSPKEFDITKWYELDNMFLLKGNLHNIKEKPLDEYYYIADLSVDKWEIVKPIKRKSFRSLYAPKSYLTIYDYNWFKWKTD